jgi:hypothetical protein
MHEDADEMDMPNIWYANEKKHRSLTKMIVYSDTGTLKTVSGGLAGYLGWNPEN